VGYRGDGLSFPNLGYWSLRSRLAPSIASAYKQACLLSAQSGVPKPPALQHYPRDEMPCETVVWEWGWVALSERRIAKTVGVSRSSVHRLLAVQS